MTCISFITIGCLFLFQGFTQISCNEDEAKLDRLLSIQFPHGLGFNFLSLLMKAVEATTFCRKSDHESSFHTLGENFRNSLKSETLKKILQDPKLTACVGISCRTMQDPRFTNPPSGLAGAFNFLSDDLKVVRDNFNQVMSAAAATPKDPSITVEDVLCWYKMMNMEMIKIFDKEPVTKEHVSTRMQDDYKEFEETMQKHDLLPKSFCKWRKESDAPVVDTIKLKSPQLVLFKALDNIMT